VSFQAFRAMVLQLSSLTEWAQVSKGRSNYFEGGAMKNYRFKAKLPIGQWLTVLALSFALAGPAIGAAPYYEGQTIEVIIPFGVAGGSDIWIRTIAPYLEKNIAGNPKFTFRNIAGGRAIPGMMEFAQKAKPDGHMVLVSSATNYFPVLLGDKAAKYDFKQWKPLLVNPVGGVMYASPASGVKRIEDLAKAKNLIYGGISAIGLDMIPLISFELLELDARGVLGFKGRGDARIAFERGETNIDYQTTPAYNATVVPLIKEGKAVPLMTFGQLNDSGNIIRDPAVPDLPTVPEVYEKLKGKKPSGKFWETYKIFMPSAFAVQKILWVKGDAPAAALQAFYAAADRLEKDKEFHAKTEKILGGYPLLRGDRLEKTIQEAFQIDAETQRFVKEWASKKYRVKFD
jgi:tripartite-type tricarboxylate transporter receptor subunit TctC